VTATRNKQIFAGCARWGCGTIVFGVILFFVLLYMPFPQSKRHVYKARTERGSDAFHADRHDTRIMISLTGYVTGGSGPDSDFTMKTGFLVQAQRDSGVEMTQCTSLDYQLDGGEWLAAKKIRESQKNQGTIRCSFWAPPISKLDLVDPVEEVYKLHPGKYKLRAFMTDSEGEKFIVECTLKLDEYSERPWRSFADILHGLSNIH